MRSMGMVVLAGLLSACVGAPTMVLIVDERGRVLGAFKPGTYGILVEHPNRFSIADGIRSLVQGGMQRMQDPAEWSARDSSIGDP